MTVIGRTHRPVLDRERCQRCSVCVRECPAEFLPELRSDEETARGYVYNNTDLTTRRVLPPCAGECPLGQQVRDYVQCLGSGRVKDAVLLIREDNPLPGICAYVCHHPCERACVRGSWDDPVSIRELKRYAVHYEMDHRDEMVKFLKECKPSPRGKKVVIVGAGPAGLACGYTLVMEGYAVALMDSLSEPGGLLVGGIPRFRLPRSVIDHDIGIIRSLGVEFIGSLHVGRDVSLRQVSGNGADAVVLATGAWEDLRLGVAGEGTRGYFTCLDFLGAINSGQVRRLLGTVAVVGGGNAALDTARSALRLGPKKVIVVYRRSREEMPAAPEEIEAAEQEGVIIRYLLGPKRVVVEGGKVAGLELVKMKLGEHDETGRRRPIPIEGSNHIERADVVIAALGQRPRLSFLDPKSISERNTISCDASGMVMGYEGVFAAGDAVCGPSTVVEAMASGKAAAQQVIGYLQGI